MHWVVDEHLNYLINFPKRKYKIFQLYFDLENLLAYLIFLPLHHIIHNCHSAAGMSLPWIALSWLRGTGSAYQMREIPEGTWARETAGHVRSVWGRVEILPVKQKESKRGHISRSIPHSMKDIQPFAQHFHYNHLTCRLSNILLYPLHLNFQLQQHIIPHACGWDIMEGMVI